MKYCSVCNEKFDDSISFCPKDGEVLEEDSGSLVGKALDGQYQIEALLGKGGMGAVFRARHILLGDRVAIKVLPPEMRSNTEWLRRFQREGQAARRFRHPNAVTVYDLRTKAAQDRKSTRLNSSHRTISYAVFCLKKKKKKKKNMQIVEKINKNHISI